MKQPVIKVAQPREKKPAGIDFDGSIKVGSKKVVDIQPDMDNQVYLESHYEDYKKTNNKNIFESVIQKMMVESCMDETFKPYIEEIKEILAKKISHSKKRFAILCTLDKNRSLMCKAKIYNDMTISKIDHIKDYIQILRKYVKVSEVEKKKFGEVMTPIALVTEMLNKLPRDVWSNPDLKWLDPCNGVGPFGALVVAGLMKGLTTWEPDEEKRYKHIIENMVCVCELQPKNMFLWMCMMDPKDEYDMNIYCGSFLDVGFDRHMKEVWGIDKFDVVVGNPPYNSGNIKNYYIDFFEQSFNCLSKNGYMSFVTPSRYVIQPEYEQFRKKVESISNKILLNNKGRAFGDFASFTVVATTLFLGNNGKCLVNWVDGIGDSVVEKVINYKCERLETKRSKAILKTKEERDSYLDYQTDGNIYRYFVNSCGTRDTPYRYLPIYVEDSFKSKIVCTEFVGTGNYKTLGNPIVDENGDFGLASDTAMYIMSNDVIKLNKLKIWFSSKIMDYLLTKICQSSHVNQTMRLLPDISSLIEDESDIYKLFNLTEGEKNMIINKKY
jgi:hypothetical protein